MEIGTRDMRRERERRDYARRTRRDRNRMDYERNNRDSRRGRKDRIGGITRGIDYITEERNIHAPIPYGRTYKGHDFTSREYDRGSYPFEMYGNVEMDFAKRGRRRDYGDYNDYNDYNDYMDCNYDYYSDYEDYGSDYLSEDELMEWGKKLLKDIPEQYKNFFSLETIEKKAKELGIKMKEYTQPELYVTTLAMATDYGNTLGFGNLDMFIKLAKDFLEDKDSELKGGEKLTAYYDFIVCPK